MMNRSSALRALCIWLAVTLVGLLIAVNSRFSADRSFFLPSQPTAEQAVLVEQLKTGVPARLLLALSEYNCTAALLPELVM